MDILTDAGLTAPPGIAGVDTDSEPQGRVVSALSEAASLHLGGRLEEAAGVLTRAIESGGGNPALQTALGRILYEKKDFSQAAASYSQLTQLDPPGFTGHFNLGVCRANLREWGPAAEAFRRAVEAEPMNADALFALGTCLVYAHRPQEAVDALHRRLEFFPDRQQKLTGKAADPQFGEALLYLGHALLALGREEEACSYWRRAIRERPELAAASPVATAPAGPAPLDRFPPLPCSIPRLAIGVKPALPRGEWIPQEYYCQSGPKKIRQSVAPIVRPIEAIPPGLAEQAVADGAEEAPPTPDRLAASRTPEIFPVREKPLRRRRTLARGLGFVMAASLLVGIGVWVGGIGKAGKSQGSASTPLAVIVNAPRLAPIGRTDGPQLAPGPVAWVKQALARRAAMELTDSFEGDMGAWGNKPRGEGLGWSRQPGGYVRPGRLELFRPSLDFTDYHMEFLGQIESKGMSWVVRARDARNYVAMKFKVVAPGARPLISMVHYPVREGRTGARVETPITVMVHANTAYHVEVAVKGNRFAVSIEGQEVDSWTDDAPSYGGVGFFSEVSERARLYWVKIYKNDDWWGRVCGFISGARAPSESAWQVGEPSPARVPKPRRPPVQTAVWDKRQSAYAWRAQALARI